MIVRAVTLDLDDTLWPFAPVAQNIGQALQGWLEEHAPRTAARFDQAAAAEAVRSVHVSRPDLAHDMGAVRREALRRMLTRCDEDPGLAEDAFAVIYAARQRVELYPEVARALDRLSARLPLLALTNGNADLERTGVGRWFRAGVVSAMEVGVAKPDPAIFGLACERLELEPAAVLHAGDNLELDVAAALDAGHQAAWVRRGLEGAAPAGALVVEDLAALADALGA